MKQVFVGSYYLGKEYVDLILREDTGGEYYSAPEKQRPARIKIGADYDKWDDVFTALLHESMELVLDKIKARYNATFDFSNDHGSYLFVFRHDEFSDAVGRVADFLSTCLPDVEKGWKKWGKSRKKRKVG